MRLIHSGQTLTTVLILSQELSTLPPVNHVNADKILWDGIAYSSFIAKETRHRGVETLAWGYTARKWQSWDWDPGSLSEGLSVLNHEAMQPCCWLFRTLGRTKRSPQPDPTYQVFAYLEQIKYSEVSSHCRMTHGTSKVFTVYNVQLLPRQTP